MDDNQNITFPVPIDPTACTPPQLWWRTLPWNKQPPYTCMEWTVRGECTAIGCDKNTGEWVTISTLHAELRYGKNISMRGLEPLCLSVPHGWIGHLIGGSNDDKYCLDNPRVYGNVIVSKALSVAIMFRPYPFQTARLIQLEKECPIEDLRELIGWNIMQNEQLIREMKAEK